MAVELAAHRAELLAVGHFTEDDLAHCRSVAVAAGGVGGEPPDPKAVQVAVGYVRVYSHSSDKHTYYRVIVDGAVVEVRLRIFEKLVDGGAYRVYFTPDREKFHAIEPVAPADVPDAVADAIAAAGLDATSAAARHDDRVATLVRDGLLAALGRAFDFTSADLAANRVGRLTPREQGKLRGRAFGCFAGAVFCALVGTAVAWSFAGESLVGTAIVGALVSLLVLWLVALGVRARADATAGKVISGVGSVVRDGSSGGERKLVVENGTSFGVPLEALSVRGHHPYRLVRLAFRIYYAPNEAEVMSLEPVDLAPVLSAGPPPDGEGD